MKIIKRNGEEVDFNLEKIKNAIQGANKEVPESQRLSEQQVELIAKKIEEQCRLELYEMNVEMIQDLVEKGIMEEGAFDVAKKYITYRYQHALLRKANSTDKQILSLLECDNEEVKQENSNKNPTVVSVQRDYMAGEVSKDITRRFLLDEDIVKAHDEGVIHFHDADYFSQHMYNCFSGKTKFLTDEGARSFNEFFDGEKVNVFDKDGVLREAAVRSYGFKTMQKVVLKTNKMRKEFVVTPNHRWILSDGTVTTNLAVGDKLLGTKGCLPVDFNAVKASTRNAKIFALGFIIGDGCDKGNYTQVRLCGEKNKYADIFTSAGYVARKIEDDILFIKHKADKQAFLNEHGWRYMTNREKQILFYGYMCADGCNEKDGIWRKVITADSRIVKMIQEICSLCGYYVSRVKEHIHDTNYKKNAFYTEIGFVHRQKANTLWTVESVEPCKGAKKAWCIEEPITHSFILEGGVITGNCCLINLEDMLQHGTIISGVKIEKPHSFSTACNIATQIIAQVASCQYGF